MVMVEMLEILSTLLEFFAFVFAATAIFCVPVVVLLWVPEVIEHYKLSRRARRRAVVPVTRVA
jgi:hypothetical protein